jgi:hypothetical protein
MSQNSNPDSESNSNSLEEAYLTLVHSYINATRDILNGYMTFETGLTRAINSQIVRNFTRSSFTAPGPRTSVTVETTTTQPELASVETTTTQPELASVETPANLIRRETAQIPDTPVRPTLRFRSTLPSNSSQPSSPFQIPTPVRLTSRLDAPPEERESRRSVLPLPRRAPLPEPNVVSGERPFASTFVRYGLPVPIGPARRVPVTNAASSTESSSAPSITGNSTILRSALEVPIFSPPHSPPHSPPPPPAIPFGQTWQQMRQRRQERQQDSLSPILPDEPTPLPPVPLIPLTTATATATATATRLMLNLLDTTTPHLNDSLVYYTQIIDREFARSREGRMLSYDVIQQQTKIIPYCTIIRPLNDICPISQVQFDLIDSVMQINTCKHNFNPYSLLRWFDSNSTCPMCRQQINVNLEHDDNDDNHDEQTIDMYNNGLPYRSESVEHRENNYNHDDSDFSSVG